MSEEGRTVLDEPTELERRGLVRRRDDRVPATWVSSGPGAEALGELASTAGAGIAQIAQVLPSAPARDGRDRR
ncbi:MAG: hypothetical protein J2P28_18160 [Actinobacteria bacterium]|nr:hypothetical protein [Actinomycetota bacterium]